jgi:hypothetical protein
MTAQLIRFSERCPVCAGSGAESFFREHDAHVSREIRICGVCNGRKILQTNEAYEAERKRKEGLAK